MAIFFASVPSAVVTRDEFWKFDDEMHLEGCILGILVCLVLDI